MRMTERKKLIIYKILLFLLAFIVAFMPATASRSREVNSRVIVEMLGVDGGEDGVEVTAQYVMPTETEGASTKDSLTVKGRDITQAVETLSTALGRKAELGHCSMVIVGADASADALGTLLSGTDITADVYLSAADDKAGELVKDLTEFMKKTGATDADFIAYGAKKGHVATNTLLGFLSDLGSASRTAYLPVVEMIEEKSQGEGSSGGDSGQGGRSGQSSDSKKTGMKVEKLALYSPDGRMGVLSSDGARGVAWINAPVSRSVVLADVELGGEKRVMTGRLLKKKSKIHIDGPSRAATVELDATIEPGCTVYNELVTGADAQNEVKRDFALAIEKELARAYVDGSKLGLDPMFIVRQFHRYAPDTVESGLNIRDITVRFDVKVTLK